MERRFYPDFFYESVQTIPYSFFEAERIKAVIFDMDNTLVNSKHEYEKEVKNWIKGLKKQGIKMCILSNTFNFKEVTKISREFSIPFLYRAFKPTSLGFKKALKLLKEEKNCVAMIGDQIFTDILRWQYVSV